MLSKMMQRLPNDLYLMSKVHFLHLMSLFYLLATSGLGSFNPSGVFHNWINELLT